MGKPCVEITLSDSKDAEKSLKILNSLDFVSDCERDDSRITAVIRDEKFNDSECADEKGHSSRRDKAGHEVLRRRVSGYCTEREGSE